MVREGWNVKRKHLIFPLAVLTAALVAGCASGNPEAQEAEQDTTEASASAQETDETAAAVQEDGSRILVMYFDQGMNSDGAGDEEVDAITTASLAGWSSPDVTVNNIRVMKNEIEAVTGAEDWPILIEQTYAADYEDMVNTAQDDQNSDKQFSFRNGLPDLSRYDTVFLGTPVWWGTLPQPVASMLEQLDFSGRTIIPFGIHLGSSFGDMIDRMEDYEPDATVIEDGLTINSRTANDEVVNDVDDWLTDLGWSG